MPTLPDPAALASLLAHLSTCGELYPAEVERPARAWLPLLVEGGWLARLPGGAFGGGPTLLTLGPDCAEADGCRHICFNLLAYRRYLIAALAQGLVQAGQVDYHAQLAAWLTGPLAGLAPEINALLDALAAEGPTGDTARPAAGSRLVEWSAAQVAARFARWHADHKSFAPWDRA